MFTLSDCLIRVQSQRAVVVAELEVTQGRVGVGCLNVKRDAFIVERFVEAQGGCQRIAIRVPASELSEVVFRNASPGGASHFRVLRLGLTLEDVRRSPWPVDLLPREIHAEPVRRPEELKVFNDELAVAINRARMDFIEGLALPLEGRRVLDVGAGIGHFAEFYRRMGATVVAIEGRSDNVDEMQRLYPQIEVHVGDVQEVDLTALGRFDVVHCFGLLYHLDSPVGVLRRIERVCRDVLLLETIVCDSSRPVMLLTDEPTAMNQALTGLGCRPSPSFVAMALNRLGFPFVYGATRPPDHPDFHFEWRDTLEVSRDRHNLRCVFVASRRPMARDSLTLLVEPQTS
jgi:SAM-dependent methyltransferase